MALSIHRIGLFSFDSKKVCQRSGMCDVRRVGDIIATAAVREREPRREVSAQTTPLSRILATPVISTLAYTL